MTLIFDLDDTLYEEMQFVRSQFRKVAERISLQFGLNPEIAYRRMMSELKQNGRGKVFDHMLDSFGLGTRKNVRTCLSIYRKTPAAICLPAESLTVLKRFQNWPKYIVTEGNPIAQRNKLQALGLSPWVNKAMVTHDYGLIHAKPSPYCFLRIASWERCPPSETVYIGDNPKKDFCGLKPLGFKTIRVLTGPYRGILVPEEMDAHLSIRRLIDMTPSVLETLKDL